MSMEFPPFFQPGSALHLKQLDYRGEKRWWFTRRGSRTLRTLLRCALGRRWPLHGMRALLRTGRSEALDWHAELAVWLGSLGLPLPTEVVVQLGSPGRYRKWVVVAMANEHDLGWVMKASGSHDSRASIVAEAAALRALRARLPAKVCIPGHIAETEMLGMQLSMQRRCATLGARCTEVWTALHSELCDALAATATDGAGFAAAIDRRESIRMACALRGRQAAEVASACGRLLDFADRALGGEGVPVGWTHRDFTPWNTLHQGDSLVVLDWEWADPAWIPLHDAMNFQVFPSLLRRGGDLIAWDDLVTPDGAVARMHRRLDLPGRLEAHGALYLYDLLLFYLDSDASGQPLADPVISRLDRLASLWLHRWQSLPRMTRVPSSAVGPC